MRGSRNFRWGGGGGGPGPSVIKIPDNVFIVLFLVVLHLFYRMPMVYFKENYNFPRFQRGSNNFIYLSLVLVQPMKARPYITEILLMGRKESNKKKCFSRF